jgi:hypothetical protein
MTTMRTVTFLVLGTVFFCQIGLAQTDMTSRTEFQQKKIKTIKRSSFTLWDRENQKPYDKPVLTDISEEYYDTLGNLVWKTNKTFDVSVSDMMNLRYDYEYDEHGNKVAEHLKNNFLPMNSKWKYTYDSTGKKLTETTFDLHEKPHQTRYYFYNDKGVLLRDSLTQQSEPLFITTYTYENGKLQKKTSLWVKKVKFQLSNETTYSYSKKGLLEKEVAVFNQSTDYKIGGTQTTLYFYDNDNRLSKEKIDDRIIEYHYDKQGIQIEKCDYRELPVKKYSFKTPFCDKIEYEYY